MSKQVCERCGKRYDPDEVKWDFGDILMEKLGYQGDVLSGAIEEVLYDYCAECNYEIFDSEAFEDEFSTPMD